MTLSNIRGNWLIDLMQGADSLLLGGGDTAMQVAGTLVVKMGGRKDNGLLSLRNITVAGHTSLALGGGNDAVDVVDAVFRGRFRLHTAAIARSQFQQPGGTVFRPQPRCARSSIRCLPAPFTGGLAWATTRRTQAF